jgi:hypothetical protein
MYAVPTPGPKATPETLAYVVDFRTKAHAAGYDNDAIARLMDAEVAAGRMPPEGPQSLRTLGRLHKISVAFLIVVICALLVVPVARHGRALLGSVDKEKPERKRIDYPKPRRLGDASKDD